MKRGTIRRDDSVKFATGHTDGVDGYTHCQIFRGRGPSLYALSLHNNGAGQTPGGDLEFFDSLEAALRAARVHCTPAAAEVIARWENGTL